MCSSDLTMYPLRKPISASSATTRARPSATASSGCRTGRRTVVQLYYGRDLSLVEVGAVLEISPSRVCQILTEARSRLRRHLRGQDVDHSDLEMSGAA